VIGVLVACIVGAFVAEAETVFDGFFIACAVCVPANAFWMALFGRGVGNEMLPVEVATEAGDPEADLWQAVTRVKSKIPINKVSKYVFFMVNIFLFNII
jgi:hypothetical protein